MCFIHFELRFCFLITKKKQIRMFVNKLNVGVKLLHYDAVPATKDPDSLGTASWTVVCHICKGPPIHLTMQAEEGKTIKLQVKTEYLYGFPGYRVLHSTAFKSSEDCQRFLILGFFDIKSSKVEAYKTYIDSILK